MPSHTRFRYLWFAFPTVFTIALLYVGYTQVGRVLGAIGYFWMAGVIGIYLFNTYRFFISQKPGHPTE